MFEDVIHGDDVVPAQVPREIGGLQRAFENVVPSSSSFGGYLRLDLDPGALQIEEATELVEMPAVPGADIKDAARGIVDKLSVEAGPRPGTSLHQQPSYGSVILIVGMVIIWIEGRKLGLGRTRIEELGTALVTPLDPESSRWLYEVLEIHDIVPVLTGALRPADRTNCLVGPSIGRRHMVA
jgi:hypothetical protein